MNKITQITKKAIFDEMRLANIFYLSREMEEDEFWQRLYNLMELPSEDGRFNNMAGDLHQHRIFNYDWDDYWFLSDSRINLMTASDEEFLRFLAETLHPLVRTNKEDVEKLLAIYNKNLKEDGFELVVAKTISGRGIYAGREITTGKYTNAILLEASSKLSVLDNHYLIQQLDTLKIQLDTNPEHIIGQCKELIESFAKTLLEELGETKVDDFKFHELVDKVNDRLGLVPNNVSNEKKGSETIKEILSSMTLLVNRVNKLRALYGTGHGKGKKYIGLTPRHAQLVFGLTSTVLIFWVETYRQKEPNIT